jgi:hypothetical protein
MPDSELALFDHAQVIPGLPGGFHFPTRMTALALGGGELALISPVPIDDAVARQLEALGKVSYLIAPNLHHNLYLAAASERYPEAHVLVPPGLAARRPELRVSGTLDGELPAPLARALDVVHIEGAAALDEYVFFQRASGTLVVADLVFNVLQPRGFWANVALWLVGCHGRLGQSRAWRVFVKDRAAMARSVERVLALPVRTLVMAHGEVVRDEAHARLASALRRWLPARAPLPAQT